MKIKKLLGARLRETPTECKIKSHAFMIRGSYLKNVASGIFSFYTPAKRIKTKIENIIRQEMNAIEGQEVSLPVVMPAAMWKESGRYDAIGSELVSFKDRKETTMILGMTHEEAAVHLIQGIVNSYNDFPFMIYQIQTKFRDEPRARAGLIRAREFTMKDAYSFHTSKEDLKKFYQKCQKTYEKIFKRVGVPEVISVKSDSGMMGGNVAHEFMLINEMGEDSLAICTNCEYKSNVEIFKEASENFTCPRCLKKSITIKRGIEVGNIFQLEDKYTKKMNIQYVDRHGKNRYPIMGCYGIGIDRLIASICEVSCDNYGPVWPVSVAPWHIHMCAINFSDENVKKVADKLYHDFLKSDFEIVYDDRKVSPGVMFSDADLLGIPIRIIISPRSLKNFTVEIAKRDKTLKKNISVDEVLSFVQKLIFTS
ncbi:MAG: hypothetical protein LBF33_01435 [Oscillospiraceae bacterium]|jgi:prolyl-tRNA synthetase|nr:hypothetical protein [Oscillospiraceae bacterium]